MQSLRSGWFRTGFRLGLLLVALPVAGLALWIIAVPRGWFDVFMLHDAYNEHLVYDVGWFHLAMAVLMLLAAVRLTVNWVRLSLATWLVFAIPHLFYHWTHRSAIPTSGISVELTLLSIYAVLPVGLLLLSARLNEGGDGSAVASTSDYDENSLHRLVPARDRITRFMKWGTEQQFGQPLESLNIIGHHGWVMFGATCYETAVTNFDTLDDRLKSLVQLRVAQIVGCPW